ncbi:MAG: hypothetical protein KF725_03165 [Cyclobacteriaceae bacterium]|nr:hypothetical protein [Cyclobacteriaceae bacterium]UYN86567.1 MAG: hypothetical protein KIT51_17170 [Cyclobacteriaceae bacterium]
MKFIKRFFLILLIIGIGTLAFLYWGVYERGVWAGKVLSISEKGMIFKTHEGKISMESFGALKGASPIAETRDFSVEKSETEVLKTLQEVALKGDRVNLHFIKRYAGFPWRGDTKYFVVRVEQASE